VMKKRDREFSWRPNTMRRRLSAVRLVDSLAQAGWSYSFAVMQGEIVEFNCFAKSFQTFSKAALAGVFSWGRGGRVTLACWAKREKKEAGRVGRDWAVWSLSVSNTGSSANARKGPDPIQQSAG
jgi:hypothetical protein